MKVRRVGEIVYVEGWKGKDRMQILDDLHDHYTVVEHRKDKDTGVVKTNTHEIDKADVAFLAALIRKHCVLHEIYDYRYIVRRIIEAKGLHEAEGIPLEQMIETFNGGKYRSKYYFPLYYYPILVLEAKGHVHYSGGTITRIKEEAFNVWR